MYEECQNSMAVYTDETEPESEPEVQSLPAGKDDFSHATAAALVRKNDDDNLVRLLSRKVYYISDIHLFHHIAAKYPYGASDGQIEEYVRNYVSNMFPVEFAEDGRYLLIGGDVSHSFQLASMFYKELRRWLDQHRKYPTDVFIVLGNHELWEFESLEACQKAYLEMLEPLGFTMLCNEAVYLDFRPPTMQQVWDKESKKQAWVPVDPEKNPDGYDKALVKNGGFVLAGGTGFAGMNTMHNANNGYYRDTLNRQQEIEESARWREVYASSQKEARRIRGQLIVLTHNPMQDWMGPAFKGDANCIYFNGHNHRNLLEHDEERNIHVFADNQIGYKGKNAVLKAAALYRRGNPFAGYPDGYYEISSHDYLEFYAYMLERIEGNGIAEKMIRNKGCRFYMIRKSGYYGFFLISDSASYICKGGRVDWIGEGCIQYYYERFDAMVHVYTKGMESYRMAQERIAVAVRSFGGWGKIHGCIIDIDFFNHIGLDPRDGSLTFYYSPTPGQMQMYAAVDKLLEEHAPQMLDKYLQGGERLPVSYKTVAVPSGMLEVSLKEDLYGLSKRVAQLQRLYTSRILRDWNDSLLRNLPEK